MNAFTPIRRSNVAGQVADAVRLMIVEGSIGEGERINEVRLSQQLGVSRTPLREALNRLAAEGELTSRPNLGYFVKPLTLAEFEPLYAMRPILDPAALAGAGLPTPDQLSRLKALNDEIDACGDVVGCIDLDDDWHMELVAGCPNPILLDLIGQFMRRTRRYELALLRDRGEVRAAVNDHREVMAALDAGDLDGACEALRQNLIGGAAPIAAWLRERNPGGDE